MPEHIDADIDAHIKAKGYRLFARPKVGEALWRLRFSDGTYSPILPQGEVLDLIEEWESRNPPKRKVQQVQ